MTHHFDWPYLRLRADGVLVYDDTGVPLAIAKDGSTPCFSDLAAAEAWLVENDVRGSVQSCS